MFPVPARFAVPGLGLAAGACALVLVGGASAQGRDDPDVQGAHEGLDVRIRRQRAGVEGQGRAVRLGR